jgi:membrane-bound lytic murein transglycosylase B
VAGGRRAWHLSPELRAFTKAFWDYIDLLVTEERIAKGREMLAQHAAAFQRMEQAYGVDRHVVTAIWGIETKFGAVTGERPVIRSVATLACIGRRQAYFKDEFLAALEILHRGDIAPERLKGSWAGAFGLTQFMPTAFKRYAVDFDGDGRRDVATSVPDVIASTANHLKKVGWQTGQTWGYEVVLPQGFNFMLADTSRKLTLHEWTRHGIVRASREPFARPNDRAYLFLPAGSRGPAFLMLENFHAIMKYNPAEAGRAGPHPRRAAGVPAAPQPARLRRRRAERPVWTQDPGGRAGFSGPQRDDPGRVRHSVHAGPSAALKAPRAHLQVDIFRALMADGT